MWNLHDVLWVIPGVIFIHLYNKRRTNDTISLSGWPYLFFLVVIASFTWLPAELIVENDNGLINKILVLFVSIFFTLVLFCVAQMKVIYQWIFLPEHDNFYKKCIEWENKEILLNLKNGKAYQGLLWKYPENPKSRYESQTISIVPFKVVTELKRQKALLE